MTRGNSLDKLLIARIWTRVQINKTSSKQDAVAHICNTNKPTVRVVRETDIHLEACGLDRLVMQQWTRQLNLNKVEYKCQRTCVLGPPHRHQSMNPLSLSPPTDTNKHTPVHEFLYYIHIIHQINKQINKEKRKTGYRSLRITKHPSFTVESSSSFALSFSVFDIMYTYAQIIYKECFMCSSFL